MGHDFPWAVAGEPEQRDAHLRRRVLQLPGVIQLVGRGAAERYLPEFDRGARALADWGGLAARRDAEPQVVERSVELHQRQRVRRGEQRERSGAKVRRVALFQERQELPLALQKLGAAQAQRRRIRRHLAMSLERWRYQRTLPRALMLEPRDAAAKLPRVPNLLDDLGHEPAHANRPGLRRVRRERRVAGQLVQRRDRQRVLQVSVL
jgi:hypothetical protein